MPKITLEQAKLHLRVDGPEEDVLISSWILAAYLAIEGKIFRKVVAEEPAPDSLDVQVDEAINSAVLLILGHLHENRGSESVEMPQAAIWLVTPYINYAGGA